MKFVSQRYNVLFVLSMRNFPNFPLGAFLSFGISSCRSSIQNNTYYSQIQVAFLDTMADWSLGESRGRKWHKALGRITARSWDTTIKKCSKLPSGGCWTVFHFIALSGFWTRDTMHDGRDRANAVFWLASCLVPSPDVSMLSVCLRRTTWHPRAKDTDIRKVRLGVASFFS